MLATAAGGLECYLLLLSNQQIVLVDSSYISNILWMKHDFCRFLRREACSVVGGLFAVQCRAEGRWMVPKLGIKGGERWAAAASSTNFPQLKEVKARSESSSAHVTNPLLHILHNHFARVTNRNSCQTYNSVPGCFQIQCKFRSGKVLTIPQHSDHGTSRRLWLDDATL